ncbi:MAG: hypothetical protein QY323_04600 [Patescibacteria group bacterium]|nr:MAG: hypothetical protein QY323_04600 [Patescibacteria group bacterium]
MKNVCSNPREITLLKWSLRGLPFYILAIAIVKLATGCVTVEGDDPVDCGDNIVVVEPPDPESPPVERARVDMALNVGFQYERSVGAQDIPVFCFTAVANVDVEVRRLRMFIAAIGENTAAGGLVDTSAATLRPNFTDIKVLYGINVVAGPRDVDATGNDTYQPIDLVDIILLEAHRPTQLCVYLDTANNVALDGTEIQIQLGSPMLGDMVRVDDETPVLVEDIHPNTGIVGPFTNLVANEPTSPSVPMTTPVISVLPLPTNVLSNGTQVVARVAITADTGADIHVKKLSFHVNTNPSITVEAPRIRELGMGGDLAGTSYLGYAGQTCGFGASTSEVCAGVVFDQPIIIAAGTTVSLELRLTVSGADGSGETLTTTLARDVAGFAEGVLAGSGVDTTLANVLTGGALGYGMLWSNDGTWYYNAHSITGTPVAQTLTRS